MLKIYKFRTPIAQKFSFSSHGWIRNTDYMYIYLAKTLENCNLQNKMGWDQNGPKCERREALYMGKSRIPVRLS